MGRKKMWKETMTARLPEGTIKRIKAVLGEPEDMTDFVRMAIEEELRKRENRLREGNLA